MAENPLRGIFCVWSWKRFFLTCHVHSNKKRNPLAGFFFFSITPEALPEEGSEGPELGPATELVASFPWYMGGWVSSREDQYIPLSRPSLFPSSS